MPYRILRTVKAIEWTVMSATAIGAVYSLMRFMIDGWTVALSDRVTIIDTDGTGLAWTLTLLIGSFLVSIGLIKDSTKWKRHGWFVLVFCRMLQVIGHFIILGPVPLTWMYPATLMGIMIILYIHNGLELNGYKKPPST